MKLQDFDFRVWSDKLGGYAESPFYFLYLYTTGQEIHAKIDNKEINPYIELWCGFCDKNLTKIYEGDIVAHYVEGGGIEYYSKVVFNQEKGAFEFVCIEHPIIESLDKLANPDIEVVGNIHENPELLGGEE